MSSRGFGYLINMLQKTGKNQESCWVWVRLQPMDYVPSKGRSICAKSNHRLSQHCPLSLSGALLCLFFSKISAFTIWLVLFICFMPIMRLDPGRPKWYEEIWQAMIRFWEILRDTFSGESNKGIMHPSWFELTPFDPIIMSCRWLTLKWSRSFH